MKTSLLRTACALTLLACGGGEKPAAAPPPPPAPTATVSPVAEAPAPPPAPKLSRAERQLKTTQALNAAYSAHDTKPFATLYAADAVKTLPTPTGWMELKGLDEITKQAQGNLARGDATWTSTRIVQKGDTNIVEYVMSGTFGQTGKKVGLRGCTVQRFDDEGRIKAEHVYIDVATAMIQAGLAPGHAAEPIPAPTGEAQVVTAKGDASDDKNVDLMKTGWATSWTKKDRKAFEALVTDDYVQEDLGWSMTSKGKKDAGAAMERFTKAVPDVVVTVDDSWGAGDVVVSRLTLKGTHKGPLGPLKPTNKPFSAHVLSVSDVKDGKLAKTTVYMNSLEVLSQLGVVPPQK